jgi:hypothetical protein
MGWCDNRQPHHGGLPWKTRSRRIVGHCPLEGEDFRRRHDDLAGCGQTACRTSGMRCRERSSREKRSISSGQRPRMDFGHGLSAGCGQTACRTSGMRCRERSSREKRSISSGQRPRMDFGHGLSAGCGHTACRTSGMRCRECNSREKRSVSSGQRPWMDFGHGLSGRHSPEQVVAKLRDASASERREGSGSGAAGP